MPTLGYHGIAIQNPQHPSRLSTCDSLATRAYEYRANKAVWPKSLLWTWMGVITGQTIAGNKVELRRIACTSVTKNFPSFSFMTLKTLNIHYGQKESCSEDRVWQPNNRIGISMEDFRISKMLREFPALLTNDRKMDSGWFLTRRRSVPIDAKSV